MAFFIYPAGDRFALATTDEVIDHFPAEATALDVAVRHAQDRDALYAISYFRPH